MELMIRRLLSFILLVTLCFSGAAFAQDPDAARLEAERAAREAAIARASEARVADDARRERERVAREMATDNRAVIEAAHGGAERYREMLLRVEYEDLRQALRAYQAARQDL